MDDLIVIILTLVLIIASSLGQFKKKPSGESKVNNNIPDNSDDNWLLPGENEVKDIKEKPLVTYTGQDNIQKKNVQSYQFKDDFTSVKQDRQTIQEIQNHSVKKVKKIKFSLRKAVIYNEILNRKYT
jgi:hypothetical protein